MRVSSGNANFVFFIDYLAGRKSGFYWPSLPPTYQKKNYETNNKKRVDYMNIMTEELPRLLSVWTWEFQHFRN